MSYFDKAFDDIADKIAEIYSALKDDPICPAPKSLSEIVGVAYAASMRTEELRPVRFALLCADQNFAKRVNCDTDPAWCTEWDVHRLNEPQPLAVETIRKLSASLDESQSALAVWPGENDSSMIWGLIRFSDRSNSGPPQKDNAPIRYRDLRISSTRPGRLTFDTLREEFASLKEGDVVYQPGFSLPGRYDTPFHDPVIRLVDAAFDDVTSRDGRFRRRSWSHSQWIEQDRKNDPDRGKQAEHWVENYRRTAWQELYMDVLDVMIRTMFYHGRGGTLIITPDTEGNAIRSKQNEFHGLCPDNSRVDGAMCLQSRMSEYFQCLQSHDPSEVLCEIAERDKPLEEIQEGYFDRMSSEQKKSCAVHEAFRVVEATYSQYRELTKAAQFCGRLTAADGAIVMLPSLRLLATAAKLEDAKEKGSGVEVRQLTREQGNYSYQLTPYSAPRGTRFSSATSYAQSVPGSLVLVASSDGDVSAITASEDAEGGVIMVEPLAILGRR